MIRANEALCLCGGGTTRRVVLSAPIGFAQRICRACGAQAEAEETIMTGLGFNRGNIRQTLNGSGNVNGGGVPDRSTS